MKKSINIAVTMGDPGGIGPEIALKTVYRSKWPGFVNFTLIGCRDVWLKYARQLRLPRPTEIKNIAEPVTSRINIWDPVPSRFATAAWKPGKTGQTEGLASLLWIRAAVTGCQQGKFDAILTGPICKHSIQAAGSDFAGHTEYLAHLAGVKRVAMMLMGGPLRVVLATRHISLKQVPKFLTRRAVRDAIKMAVQGVKWLNLPRKTIGVCALNPHGGENGSLGDEEKTVIIPAVSRLRRKGVAIAGPIPADVIFYQAMQNRFGAVVAMYHDQGLAPLKMIAFETGINLTLGLPFVRTSPDHGTAFDIAGKKIASAASMVAAAKLALQLAQRPNPWNG